MENKDMAENDAACGDRWACFVCGKPSDGDDRRSVSIPGDEPGSELRVCSAMCMRRYRNAVADIPVETEYAERLRDGFSLLYASENPSW